MTTLDSLENRLVEAYRAQAGHYDEALRIIQEDGQALEQEVWTHDLQTALQHVAAVEFHLRADKHDWQQSGRKPGAELHDLLEAIKIKIQALTAAIDRRSAELIAQKQRLLPAMDQFIRQRQMLNRYEQFAQHR
jgi:hypothetical protein